MASDLTLKPAPESMEGTARRFDEVLGRCVQRARQALNLRLPV
jgi:hypothetical protein